MGKSVRELWEELHKQRAMDEWEESKHKRAKNGQFSSMGGEGNGGSSKQTKEQAEREKRKYNMVIEPVMRNNVGKVFGDEIDLKDALRKNYDIMDEKDFGHGYGSYDVVDRTEDDGVTYTLSYAPDGDSDNCVITSVTAQNEKGEPVSGYKHSKNETAEKYYKAHDSATAALDAHIRTMLDRITVPHEWQE